MPSQAGLPTTQFYAEEAQLKNGVYTTSNGVPVAHPYEVLRVGTDEHPDGPLLLQDFHLIGMYRASVARSARTLAQPPC